MSFLSSFALMDGKQSATTGRVQNSAGYPTLTEAGWASPQQAQYELNIHYCHGAHTCPPQTWQGLHYKLCSMYLTRCLQVLEHTFFWWELLFLVAIKFPEDIFKRTTMWVLKRFPSAWPGVSSGGESLLFGEASACGHLSPAHTYPNTPVKGPSVISIPPQ